MQQNPLSPEELTALVMRSQNGDTDAFGKIYDAYLTPMYRYVVFRFPEEMAEDLVADIFVKAWEKLHTYKLQKNVPFSAWLFRIARHVVIDAYRKHRGFDELTENLKDESAWNDPRQRVEKKFALLTVRKALNELPRRYRETLLLSYVSDLTHAEIAKAMGVREGTVRILKFRALKKLESNLPRSLRDSV